MNDLHKYIVGTVAGIILCLLIWGGYSILSGKKGENTLLASDAYQQGSTADSVSGRISGTAENGSASEAENAALPEAHQKRLLSAQAANESLANRHGGNSTVSTQNGLGLFENQRENEGSEDVLNDTALAISHDVKERESEQENDNRQLEADRSRVRNYIVQGKSAAQKNQQPAALDAFEQADTAMPNDKDFEAASYHDMASSLFLLSKTNPDEKHAQEARDEAERYIKKSLAARNNADARELYSAIIFESQKTALEKQQQMLAAQQQEKDQERAQKLEENKKRQVVQHIGEGKNAAHKRRVNSAVSSFDKAAASMPANTQFASDSYMEMADALLNLSQYAANDGEVQLALNKAESYIKEAIAAQNSTAARKLYAQILDVRKEAEQRVQAKQREEVARALAQKQEAEQRAQADKRKEAEQRTQAASMRKQQEQAARELAQKKAEERRKEDEQRARIQEYQRAQAKQREEAARALAQKQEAEQRAQADKRKEAEQRTQAASMRKQQEQAAQSPAHKQVTALISQGTRAVQQKQLDTAQRLFTRAERFIPKDVDFAENAYRTMADVLIDGAARTNNKRAARNVLKKAHEYIQKALAAKETPESQEIARKIAEAQAALQTKTNDKARTEKPASVQTQRKNQPVTEPKKHGAQAAAAKGVQKDLFAQKHAVSTLVQQGKSAAAQGDSTGAEKAFAAAAAQMPAADAAFAAEQYREMADALQSLAKTANNGHLLDTAAGYIKKSIAAGSVDGSAHYVYAQIADAQNNTALAIQELEAACRLIPRNEQYTYELGRKYFEQKRYPDARACFERAVKINPQFEEAFFNLGMTHKIMNARDAALIAFSKAASLKPQYVRAWIEIARIQGNKSNYREAVKSYQKVLSLDPSNVPAVKEMAQIYAKQNDTRQAEKYFKQALALGDTDPITYYNLASVQLDLDKQQDALENAEKAAIAHNKDARILYTYGLALERNKRLREAEDYYTHAVAADEKYGKPRINLGRIQLEAGNLENAEQHLQVAYRLEPHNFEVNMNLGKLYGLRKQYEKAGEYYRNAIKIMPKDTDAHHSLAAAYLSAGLKENARDTYQAFIKTNPQSWDSYYELGKVCISLNSKVEAKTAFNQLLMQKPDYRYAAEVKKLLENL